MTNFTSSGLTRQSIRSKANALESAIQLMSEKFKDLMLEVQKIEDESKTYEEELVKHREKCDSKTCRGSEGLKNIIQIAASTTVRINETKNLSFISELLTILSGEVSTLTPPKNSQENKENVSQTTPVKSPKKNILTRKVLSPKKDLNTSAEDISFNEESITEIAGTPGSTSPIIGRKKLKSSGSSTTTFSVTTVDSREKKKCPNSWPTSEAKQVKLASSPNTKSKGVGRSRQGRLTTFFSKPSHVVDLTGSPEVPKAPALAENPQIKLLIKQESSDNDDTILPSPTSSGPIANPDISSKQLAKEILKQKRSLLSLKIKKEVPDGTENTNSPIISVVDKKVKDNSKDDLEKSVNILQPNRIPKNQFKEIMEQGPVKKEPLTNDKYQIESPKSPENTTLHSTEKARINLEKIPVKCEGIPVKYKDKPVNNVEPVKIKIEDLTHCEEASISILQNVEGHKPMDVDMDAQNSPSKRPLVENINQANLPELENSMSLLKPETFKRIDYKPKRNYMQKLEPVYKEPAVRKRSEKMALPAWCCEECVSFFSYLYDDDPDKIEKIVSRCSKHRGRTNPARPKTPPGFWDPRWDVPTDTNEFNARNHAD